MGLLREQAHNNPIFIIRIIKNNNYRKNGNNELYQYSEDT